MNGTERVTVNLSNLFLDKNNKVVILSIFRENPTTAFHLKSNIKVVYLLHAKYNINQGFVHRISLFIKAYQALFVYLKSVRWDDTSIIIGQSFFSNVLIWLSGKSKYAVACEHFKYELYPKFIRLVRNWIYQKFVKVVVLTDNDRKRYDKHLPVGQTVTIPNMCVVKQILRPNIDVKRLIAVGRLHYQKGFDLLINAMVPVVAKHPDWTLHIYGDGELKDELNSLIIRLNLVNNIFLEGITSNIYAEYLNSSIFVLSSRYEGFAMVLLEALCLGVPSVAFNCPEGAAEMLSYGGGLLVENGNVEELSKNLLMMIENRQLREKYSNNREKITAVYSEENIYKKWNNLFEAFVNRQNQSSSVYHL